MSQIIDIHSHVFGENWVPEEWWDGLVEFVQRETRLGDEHYDSETVWDKFMTPLFDPGGERSIERMEESGIDRRVAFTVDWELGDYRDFSMEVPIEEQNRRIAEIADEHPDKLTPFVSIDPRRDNATEFVETALTDLGMEGLKLHPGSGYSPESEEAYELYEICRSHDVPVLLHSGPAPSILYSQYSHPMHLDAPLTDFPDVQFIAAHLGFGNWEELLAVGEWMPNLHTDISGWQTRAMDDPDRFASILRRFLDTVEPKNVHFGTDFPMEDVGVPEENWIDHIQSLSSREEEPTFTQNELDMILGEGAKQLLD